MGVKFLKKNKEAREAAALEDQKNKERKEAAQSPYTNRFYLKQDVETVITFLDGDLDEDGLLKTTSYHEHNLLLNGSWRNWYPCTGEFEICPICESGSRNPPLVSAFTVIDHSQYKDRNDNLRKDERKLFLCKRETVKRLQKLASKRDGLTGCTFDVSRIGDKAPGVGSDFDFVEKQTLPDIAKRYNLQLEGGENTSHLKICAPYNYEEVIMYKTAAELRALGLGPDNNSVGSEDVNEQIATPDYSNNL